MLISLCIPCGNRLPDLRQAMPHIVRAANASPPVQIAVLDYNSSDGLDQLIEHTPVTPLANGNVLTCSKYIGRSHFHKAHAFNLAMLAGIGEYCVLMPADGCPAMGYVQALRQLIAEGCVWMCSAELCGIVCCRRQEFIAAGGYDERFEFYGPEDRDLHLRLQRRGGKFCLVPPGLLCVIPTPDNDKVRNYRLLLSKREMSRRMRPILDENTAAGTLTANAGQEWGRWT